MSYVYLNGKFVKSSEATISVFDQGFLYGDGIYESFRSIGENLFKLNNHYKRLLQSAAALQYDFTYSENELRDILLRLRQRNHINNSYFRLTVSRGTGDVGFNRSIPNDLTILIIAREFNGFPQSKYDSGVEICCAQTRRNAPEAISPKIKSISNLNSLLGKLEAKERGVTEVVMLNNKDHICEGAASNIFWTKDRWVFTPSTSTGLLEGVTRSTIIDLCKKSLNLKVIEGEYKLQDIQFADEVFITSTSLEVMPVVKIDDFIINEGVVGAIAKQLRESLHKEMKK